MDMAAGLKIKAIVVILALFAEAVAGVASHQIPDRAERPKLQVAAAAVAGPPRPLADSV